MAKIKQGKKYSKKEVIIKNAAVLFKAKGFSAASMRELAMAVGVEAPSLYNHIGSKAELLQAICFTVAEAFTTQLHDAAGSKDPVPEKIAAVLQFHITMMRTAFDEVYVANHEWKHLPEPFLQQFLQQRRTYEKTLVALIEEGIKKKELKTIDPYAAVLTLLAAVRGLEFWQRQKKGIAADVPANDMVTLLLTGLKK